MTYRLELGKLSINSRRKFSKATDHVAKIHRRTNMAPENIWLEEFNIRLVFDPTHTGLSALEFPDEKSYMIWLLKWT